MSHKNRTFAVIFRQGVGNPLRGEKARRKQCRGKFGLAVNLVFEPEWDKDMMTEEAKLELGFL